jgi:hypothetical protein
MQWSLYVRSGDLFIVHSVYPNREAAAQAQDNLQRIGGRDLETAILPGHYRRTFTVGQMHRLMSNPQQFAHEHIASARGRKVRTVTTPSGHRVRLAFPKGHRRKGSGKVVSILHPEGNPEEIRVGDLIEWNQGGGRTARGTVLEVRGQHGYTVATGKKTVPVKTVTLSAKPRLVQQRSDRPPGYMLHPSNPARNVTAYGSIIRTRTAQQEWYESASGDARKRAAQLRKLGFKVSVESMGSQVTPVGRVKMTLLTIHYPEDREIPPPERVERMNPQVVTSPAHVVGAGPYVRVAMTLDDVLTFKASWPDSGLPTQEITFEFDPTNGDLVDMEPRDLEESGADPGAVLALSNDALKAAVEAGTLPDWTLSARGINPTKRGSIYRPGPQYVTRDEKTGAVRLATAKDMSKRAVVWQEGPEELKRLGLLRGNSRRKRKAS